MTGTITLTGPEVAGIIADWAYAKFGPVKDVLLKCSTASPDFEVRPFQEDFEVVIELGLNQSETKPVTAVTPVSENGKAKGVRLS